MEKSENNCAVCEKSRPSYKCPRCYAKYCSVNCCKAHRSNCPDEVHVSSESEKPEGKRNYYFPTKDTVPPEDLELLAQGSNLVELKKFLEDPLIRSNIVKLDTCAHPITEFEQVMQNENFVKFAAFVTDQLHPNDSKRQKLDLNLH